MSNPVTPAVSQAIRDTLSLMTGGEILSVTCVEDMIGLCSKPVYVVSCRDPANQPVHEDYGEYIAVYRNSYSLGLVDNLVLLTLANNHYRERLPPALTDQCRVFSAYARQYIAEQMLHIQSTEYARLLYLEPIIEYDEHLRALFALKASVPELRRSSELITRIAADFMTYHEFGHVGVGNAKYDRYSDGTISMIHEVKGFEQANAAYTGGLVEEVRCDLFSVNTLIARYCTVLAEPTLRACLDTVIRLLCRVVVLSYLARDLHRVNYNPNEPEGQLNDLLHAMSIREMAMITYLENFHFGLKSVECVGSDPYLGINMDSAALHGLADGKVIAEPLSAHSRRVAALISRGFDPDVGFQGLIAASRTQWILEEGDPQVRSADHAQLGQ